MNKLRIRKVLYVEVICRFEHWSPQTGNAGDCTINNCFASRSESVCSVGNELVSRIFPLGHLCSQPARERWWHSWSCAQAWESHSGTYQITYLSFPVCFIDTEKIVSSSFPWILVFHPSSPSKRTKQKDKRLTSFSLLYVNLTFPDLAFIKALNLIPL